MNRSSSDWVAFPSTSPFFNEQQVLIFYSRVRRTRILYVRRFQFPQNLHILFEGRSNFILMCMKSACIVQEEF